MHLHAMDAWSGALAYSLQIYFDFSGYSDMAIGLSLLFGIRLPFNFDAPYKARSIIEFWRRWHITLSRFLRDYLYIPLGGNRSGVSRRNLNLFTTMALGGLWHGAGWTFLIWGMLHGGYLIANHRWSQFVRRDPRWSIFAGTALYGMAALALTQLAVVVAWVFFRADSPVAALRVIKAMAGAADASKISPALMPALTLATIAIGYGACLVLPNVNAMFARWNVGLETYGNARRWSILALQWRPSLPWAVVASAMFVVTVTASLLAGDGSQFLYFQF
jgi:D-alanyl-lipoteichoic acid acyltransferase DltB (MBOAT superfamily)